MKADEPVVERQGRILFGKSNEGISSASVTVKDNLGFSWGIKSVGTEYFSNGSSNGEEYVQIGSGKDLVELVTFECDFSSVVALTDFYIKLGGFSGNTGSVTIKLDENTIGTGNIQSSTDTVFKNDKSAVGSKINISISNEKGTRLKVFNLGYTYQISDSAIAKENISSSNTKAQLKYSFDVVQGEGVSSFVKVTEAPKDWSGQYLIGYETSGLTNQVSVLKANLTSDSIGNDNSFSCNMDQNVIAYSPNLYDYVVNIEKITENSYSLQSNNQKFYFDGNTAKKLSTSDSPISHTLELSDADKKIIIKCGTNNCLQYNASSKIFRYYAGTQQNVYLYKYTEQIQDSYTFYNMKMNLGAIIEASKVQALMDAGLKISSYGVAVAKKSKLVESSISDAIINKDSYVSFVYQEFTSLEAMQKTDASGNAKEGNYVIFTANLPIPDTKFTEDITSVAYFLLDDGTYVFLQERTCSVKSLAQAYVDNKEVYNNFDSNIQGSLKALAALTA